MNTIYVKKNEIPDDLVKKSVSADDASRTIEGPCLVLEEGTKRRIVHVEVIDGLEDILWAMKTIKFQAGKRTLGLKSTSRTFGFRPRLTIRQDFCSVSSMANEYKEQHDVICDTGRRLAELYKKMDPDFYQVHMEKVTKEVLPEWLIEGTPFTSGICNKNNLLKYHYDSGNFKGVRSVMLILCDDVVGGELVLPAYDIKIALKNGAVVLFDGASELHGVAPFKLETKNAYRYTVVYYSLLQMRNCLTCNEEIERIRKVKRARENKRAEGRAGE